jgi:hypothetical protein
VRIVELRAWFNWLGRFGVERGFWGGNGERFVEWLNMSGTAGAIISCRWEQAAAAKEGATAHMSIADPQKAASRQRCLRFDLTSRIEAP